MAKTYNVKCANKIYTIKSAEIGGDGNRQSFEQAMAYIARKYIQDNAPSLMQYEQGFQLLEKKDDDTKAVGIVGFNVNQMQIYCPVFFLNGELKGNELMYLADQDLFVPVKEEWLNKIMGRKPIVIGEGIDRQNHRRGYTQPDLTVLRDPPVKTGSVYPNWLMKALPELLHIRGNNLEKTASNFAHLYRIMRNSLNVMDYVKKADAGGVYALKEALKKQPVIKKAFEHRYGSTKILDAIYDQKEVKESSFHILSAPRCIHELPDGTSSDKADAGWLSRYVHHPIYKNASYVSIISYSATLEGGAPFALTEDEKERLANTGHLVVDSRKDKEVSRVVSKDGTRIFNPTESDFYDVLMPDGSYKKLFVLRKLDFTPNYYDLIDLNTGTATDEENTKIWCNKKYDHCTEDCSDVPSSLKTNSGCTYIFIQGKTVLGPYCIQSEIGVNGKERIYKSGCGTQVIINCPEGSSLRQESGSVYVPSDCKCIEYLHNYDSSLHVGNPHHLKIASYGTTEDVKLYVNGDSCYINGKPQESSFTGFCSLIKDFGLREKAAEKLMKEADADMVNGHTVRFTIKRAEQPSTDSGSQFTFPDAEGMNSGAILGNLLPSSPSNIKEVSERSDAYGIAQGPYENTIESSFPQQDAQNIARAVQGGQQEVFDTSMLKQLLKNVNTQDKLEELATKLTRAMDNVGRLLFLFYWKGDDFKEIYGPQDLPELEGGLRKAFETVGDIVLFLQRKATAPISYSGESTINLAAVDD